MCTCIYNFPIISTLFISPYIIIYPRCIRRGLHWVLTHTLMKHLEWNKVETSAQTSVFCAKRLSQTEYLGNIWEVSVEPIGKSRNKTNGCLKVNPSSWSIIVPYSSHTKGGDTPENISWNCWSGHGPSQVFIWMTSRSVGPNRTYRFTARIPKHPQISPN